MIDYTSLPIIFKEELNSHIGTWAYIELIQKKTYELLKNDPAADNPGDEVTIAQHALFIFSMMYFGPEAGGVPGGFITLIQYGFGEFIFENEFADCLKEWGFDHLSFIIEKANTIYQSSKTELEKEISDEEADAFYEQFPELGKLGEEFEYHMGEEADNIIEHIQENIQYFAIVV